MSKLSSSLKKDLLTRNIVPFVGAGVSLAVKDKHGKSLFPGWYDLLANTSAKLKDKNESKAKRVEGAIDDSPPDYMAAAKHARDGLGGQWYDYLKEVFDRRSDEVDESSLETARLIWKLGSNLIVTTNYDKVLRWACEDSKDLDIWDIEAIKEQADLLRADKAKLHNATIWHLHGHISNTRNIILTPDGYDELYPTENKENVERKYEAALQTLNFLLASRPFLFVGFSFEDKAFGARLDYINKLFKGTSVTHYILLHQKEVERVKGKGMPLEPISFADYKELPELLSKMANEVGKSETAEKDQSADVIEVAVEKPVASQYNPENRAFYVPFRPKGEQVVGREDALQRVSDTLRSGRRTNIGQAVSFQGLGGLGKTQLAVEYAYRYGNEQEYQNGVIWLTIDQDVDAQLIDLAEKAQWIAPISEPKDKLAIALHRLKTLTKCLIIYDNVESPDELTEYLPESDDVHLLATSRNELSGFAPISLPLLTREQSVQMLIQEAGREPIGEDEKKAAAEIAEQLDGLPLALELAGAYLRYRGDVSWRQYLGLLERKPKSAFGGKFLSSFTRHDADVYQTLQISEELLTEETDLIRVLDLLTWSGSSPMSLSLLCSLLNVENEIDLLDPLSLGVSLRFLQKSPDGKGYAIHRLVAQVRRDNIPLEERKEWIETICERLGDWFQERRYEFSQLTEYENETEHLTIWQKHAFDYAPVNASRLLWLQAYPPYYRGRYYEARNLIATAIRLYETTFCQNRELLANLYNDYGSIFYELSDYPVALNYHNKALSVRIGLFGEQHEDVAASYNNIGNDYGGLNKPSEQLESIEKALLIQLQIKGENNLHTAYYYISLGGAYYRLKRYEDQFEVQRKALNILLSRFGENYPTIASIYEHLSAGNREIGRNELSITFAKKSLEIKQKVLGKTHPKTFNSIYHLVRSLVSAQRKEEAIALIDKSLATVSRHDDEHKELIKAKSWVLKQFHRSGFRQEPRNPHKNKKKKRR